MKNRVELITTFYQAFINLDAETMAACYHSDIVFEDPAFGVLKGERAGNMWKMLCASQKGKNFEVEFSDVVSNGIKVNAHWEAKYTFSRTGKNIHNRIDAEFEFSKGKIIKHTDHFNLHQWAKQALGFKGMLLGGTQFFKKKLNAQTNNLLSKFESGFS